jgi:hypothetical protein
MIEDFIIGVVLGFSLPFLVRFRSDILEFMKINIKKVKDET